MKKFYLKEEFTRSRIGGTLSDPVPAFKWAKIAPNKYLVILPRVFKKTPGDIVAILSGRKFLKFMDQTIIEAK